MSIDAPFSLPQPEAPSAEDSGFQVLVLARLAQIGEAVAQIHQLVSPPRPRKKARASGRSSHAWRPPSIVKVTSSFPMSGTRAPSEVIAAGLSTVAKSSALASIS